MVLTDEKDIGYDVEKDHMMTRSYFLACCIMNLLSFLLLLSFTNSNYAQDLSKIQKEKWLEPLDVGSKRNIQCFNGLLVEFVSDCPSPPCHSLRLSGNDTLECVSSSQFKNTAD